MALNVAVGACGVGSVWRLSLRAPAARRLCVIVWWVMLASSALNPFFGGFRFPYKPHSEQKGALFNPRLLGNLVGLVESREDLEAITGWFSVGNEGMRYPVSPYIYLQGKHERLRESSPLHSPSCLFLGLSLLRFFHPCHTL